MAGNLTRTARQSATIVEAFLTNSSVQTVVDVPRVMAKRIVALPQAAALVELVAGYVAFRVGDLLRVPIGVITRVVRRELCAARINPLLNIAVARVIPRLARIAFRVAHEEDIAAGVEPVRLGIAFRVGHR